MVPDVTTFAYDESSGYYYDSVTGYYYDAGTQVVTSCSSAICTVCKVQRSDIDFLPCQIVHTFWKSCFFSSFSCSWRLWSVDFNSLYNLKTVSHRHKVTTDY